MSSCRAKTSVAHALIGRAVREMSARAPRTCQSTSKTGDCESRDGQCLRRGTQHKAPLPLRIACSKRVRANANQARTDEAGAARCVERAAQRCPACRHAMWFSALMSSSPSPASAWQSAPYGRTALRRCPPRPRSTADPPEARSASLGAQFGSTPNPSPSTTTSMRAPP